jgi:predicted nucleotidyltransferase
MTSAAKTPAKTEQLATEAQARRRQALQAAEACITLLRNRFGAQRVILFGSLAGQGVWHDQSDIDLAVEGLAPADFFKAYSACDELLPPGVELDLVPLEDVYPELRVRILGEVEMPEDPILALKSLVEDELTALDRVAQQMTQLLNEGAQPPSWIELYAFAGTLQEFYNGVERIFERIAVTLAEGLPQSDSWHTDLLTQMATLRSKARPAVINEPLRARLEEYLKFRHFFRHAYNYTLEWSRMRWLAEQLGETLRMLREQLQDFFDNLTKGS